MGERVQVAPRCPAEKVHEQRLVESCDLPDRPEAAVVQLRRGHFAHAPEPLDRERVEEPELVVGRDHEQAVGLGDRARDLSQELRSGDTDRDRQPDLVEHPPPESRRDLDRRSREPLEAANVQERLVDREPLDERGRVLEHLEDGLARLRVRRHPGSNDDRVRAEAPRLPATHRRPDPERLRLVAGREYDAAADEHRFSTELPVVALLDRCEERVEVGVEDRRRMHTNTCSHGLGAVTTD